MNSKKLNLFIFINLLFLGIIFSACQNNNDEKYHIKLYYEDLKASGIGYYDADLTFIGNELAIGTYNGEYDMTLKKGTINCQYDISKKEWTAEGYELYRNPENLSNTWQNRTFNTEDCTKHFTTDLNTIKNKIKKETYKHKNMTCPRFQICYEIVE